MEGVIVLNEYLTTDWTAGFVPLVLGAILLVVCIWGAIVLFRDECIGPGAALVCLGLVSVVLVSVGVFLIAEGPETHYQVIIEDSVPINKFLEKYEIVDQEGQILIVKERETDE